MSKRCKHVNQGQSFHTCGSYAFNLHAEGIDQGEYCDVHYWQVRAEDGPLKPLSDKWIVAFAKAGNELCTDDWSDNDMASWVTRQVEAAHGITAMCSRLEQPEDEPVAWMVYVPSQQNQYFVDDEEDQQLLDDLTNSEAVEVTPLYTSPPKREWVGLTDEEVEQVFPAIATYHAANKTLYRSIARAIEATLKEKNNG